MKIYTLSILVNTVALLYMIIKTNAQILIPSSPTMQPTSAYYDSNQEYTPYSVLVFSFFAIIVTIAILLRIYCFWDVDEFKIQEEEEKEIVRLEMKIFENSEVFKKIDAAKELKKKRRLSQKENNESSCLIDEEPKACGKACVIS